MGINNISISIKKFEEELSLPKNFFNKLIDEDDWTFIIKLSALLEAVTTNILIEKIDYRNLEESISFMDYANPRTGRIKFLKDMNVLSKEHYKVLEKFALLRNQVVHKIENVDFSFDKYIEGFDKGQKKSFVKDFGLGINDEIKIKDIKISKHDFVLENPKLAIWITIGEVIACISLEKELEEYKKLLTFKVVPKE